MPNWLMDVLEPICFVAAMAMIGLGAVGVAILGYKFGIWLQREVVGFFRFLGSSENAWRKR